MEQQTTKQQNLTQNIRTAQKPWNRPQNLGTDHKTLEPPTNLGTAHKPWNRPQTLEPPTSAMATESLRFIPPER